MTRLLSHGYKVNRLSNTFWKFYGRHTDLVGQSKKNVCHIFADSISPKDPHFCRFPMAKLMKLPEMMGVMHEADHTYSIQSIW